MNKTIIKQIHAYFAAIFIIAGIISCSLPASAYSLSNYSESSVLSSGNWVKIKVEKPGMQLISTAQLKAMGFDDPSKVNVYGYGGRQISELLTEDLPDDLPVIPSLKTAAGIVFFGVDHIQWDPDGNLSNYTHTNQHYAEESYYFLSDIDSDGFELPEVSLKNIENLETANTFVERMVYEKDIFAPSNTGRVLLGEDLRTPFSMKFSLPNNIGNDAAIKLSLASNTANGGAVFKLNSNAKLNINSISLDGVTSVDHFMRNQTSIIKADNCGSELQFGINFSSSGAIKFARLDFIEIEYERELSLSDNQLYFYFNEGIDVVAALKGISSETQIWDVTVAHQPQRVLFETIGNEARFRVNRGYREFVAFNPSKVNIAVVAGDKVENQNLHGLETPDMLIVTPQEYISQAQRVAEMHRKNDRMTVHVLTPEVIYNEFSSGTPDLSAYRKLLKMWYDRGMTESEDGASKIKYCLLFSRPSYDNKQATTNMKNLGYPVIPIWQSAVGNTQNTSYSTDDFIGMLDDYDPSFRMSTAKIRVAVGRFPVRNLDEAKATVDKLINYVDNPEKGPWRNNVMLLADDQDQGQHLQQTEALYKNVFTKSKGKDYQYERLYLDNFEQKLTSVGLQYPEAKTRLFSKLEEGQALWTYIGHANPMSWTHEHLIEWRDFLDFTNTKLPVLYAATCEFARWDDDEYSGAEVIWSAPKTGVISMICPSRAVFISLNGPMSARFGDYALQRNADGSATRLGDVYVNSKNAISGSEDNKLRYALMGDPAMKMPVFSYDVVTTEIYGVDVTDPNNELPVLEARSNPVIKGMVTDHLGNKLSDFNGNIYLKLYDAEKAIETLGNGADGVVSVYNDRKTKLYEGVTKVTEGEWEIKIYMPFEIENNFYPGRITYYALADDGREANGATDRFYVYGFNQNAAEDNDGPEIHRFTLNHDGFQNGDLIYKAPIVYATFSDESGINMSTAGIGHTLSLVLDKDKIYENVMDFFSPDIDDPRVGSITYQLPEIAPGQHTLTLSVWDCANNSSYATLNFNVPAVKDPDIYDISTLITEDGIEFIISSDRALAALESSLEIYDISGVRIWHNNVSDRTAADSTLRMKWNYSSTAGNRVDKGIYICRATLTSPEGRVTQKSKKIVVTK